jgi:hypothetical protein
MSSDKERATNRLLFALSQHPEGMTTQELVEFIGGLFNQKQVPQLLRYSGYVQVGYREEGGSMNITAILWKLKKYSPSSPRDQDLKERIQAGSLG